MPKGKEINEDNVFDKENKSYSWILNLLIAFDDNKGLTREQLRYILVKDHNIYNLKNAPSRVREFFNDKIKEHLISLHFQLEWVIPNSIKSAKDLDDKLRRLCRLEIVKFEKKGKKAKYRIDRNYISKGYRLQSQKYLNFFKTNQILNISGNPQEPVSEITRVLYGISRKLFEVNQKEITDHVNGITKHLEEIKMIKLKAMETEYLKILNDICDEFKNTQLRNYIMTNQWNLFHYFTFQKPTDKNYSFDFWENKELGMSLKEKRDFLKLVNERTTKLRQELLPIDIAFSHFPYTFDSNNPINEKLYKMSSKSTL
jgi:hypothetical protein